jgi:hypothetical protein
MHQQVSKATSVVLQMMSLPKDEIYPQGITALVIKAVLIAIAGPVK